MINRFLKSLICPIGLIIVIIIFFWEMATLQGFPFFCDIKKYFYGLMTYYSEELKNLMIPLWTPYTGNGFPIFAEGATGILYPINIFLFGIFPFYVACSYGIILHFFLAGFFTYLYMRKIGLEKIVALISAFTFMLSGIFIGRLMHICILFVIAWLPLFFYFIEECFQKNRILYIFLVSIIFMFQFFAGSQQIALYSLAAFSFYFIFRLITDSYKYKDSKRSLKFLVALLLMWITVIGLSAIQVIPACELIPLSVRAVGKSTEFFYANSFPPQNFITFIFPWFFGLGSLSHTGELAATWNTSRCTTEMSCYVGILPLILAIIALFDKKNKYTLFFSLLLLLSIFLMLGKYNPLYKILMVIPGFSCFRGPNKFIYFSTFSLAILSGFGLVSLINLVKDNKKRLIQWVIRIFSGLTILAIIGIPIVHLILRLSKDRIISFGINYVKAHIYGKSTHPPLPLEYYQDKIMTIYQGMLNSFNILNPHIYIPIIFLMLSIGLIILWQKQRINVLTLKILALLLVITNLFAFGVQYNKMTEISEVLSKPKTAEFLSQDKSIFRIFTLSLSIDRKEYTEKLEKVGEIEKKLLAPNINMIDHLSSPDVNSELKTKRLKNFLNIFSPVKLQSPYLEKELKIHPLLTHLQLVSLLNIKYLLFTQGIDDERLKKVFDDGEVKIFENLEVLPRAFVVPEFKVIKNEEDILKELRSIEFDPRKYIILEEDTNVACGKPELVKNSKVNIIKYLSQEVNIDVQMTDDGFLVLSDTYYPGWKVFVDGKEDKIYQANYIIRAVYLKKGNHQVKFIYDPLSFKIGACISLITLIGIIAFFIVNGILRYKRVS